MYKTGRKRKESAMRPATSAFTEGSLIEKIELAPPAIESTRPTTLTPYEQDAERWDGLS
jgi:hypothetical protein